MANKTDSNMRLAKFLAASGIASRRRCEELILEGRVQVNGEAVLTPALNIDPSTDIVFYEGRVVGVEKKTYLLLHKPMGYTCSASDMHAKKLVFELIPKRFGRLFTVGRLDRDSAGLLILTNDGDLAQELTHPSRQVPKRYLVSCEGDFTTGIRRQMLDGIYDNGDFLHPVNVEQRGHFKGHAELEITLTDGKKREVRRLCKAVGLTVVNLQRISFGSVELGSLQPGTWRQLSEQEVENLRKTAAESRSAGRKRLPSRVPRQEVEQERRAGTDTKRSPLIPARRQPIRQAAESRRSGDSTTRRRSHE